MAVTAEQSRLFRQGLARLQRNTGRVGDLKTEIAGASSLTPELVHSLGEAGLPDLFMTDCPLSASEATANLGEVDNLLAKSRLGRQGAAAEEAEDILRSLRDNTSLNIAGEAFWKDFFTLRSEKDSAALDGFAAQLAVGYSEVRLILRSDLERRMQANGLGHVPAADVAGRLSVRGLSVVEDLPAPTVNAVQQCGTSVLGLLRPTGNSSTTYTLWGTSGAIVSLRDVTTEELDRALLRSEERGASAAAQKKALVALHAAVESGRSLSDVLTAYHLQLVAAQRAEGTFDVAVRTVLCTGGLVEEDAARLLNEPPAVEHRYSWGSQGSSPSAHSTPRRQPSEPPEPSPQTVRQSTTPPSWASRPDETSGSPYPW